MIATLFMTVTIGLCYFFFHWQFFRCVQAAFRGRELRRGSLWWTFFVNYGVFYLSSVLQLHLITNWMIFLILLMAEQILLFRQAPRKCFLLSVLGTQLGLAANILFRSLLAILLDLPLVFFDNTVSAAGNKKVYPILLGFLAAGAAFWLIRRLRLLDHMSVVLENSGVLWFLISLLGAMYVFLCMNLMVYSIPSSSMILKLWAMKSSVFVLVGEFLSFVLAVRMGRLAAYREKNQESRERMAKEKARELELRIIAATDPLTGCENRLQAKKRLEDALDSKRPFCLCFVDLNRLKTVNDGYGHEMGDGYLLSAARALSEVSQREHYLFRYGGDEFLMILYDISVSQAKEALQQAQKRLEEDGIRQGFPFPMSISYGVSDSKDGDDALALIQAADQRMYQMKTS